MRLATWNCCRGPIGKKLSRLGLLAPDIAVVQECPRPSAETNQSLWFGDNPRLGLAVFASGLYRIRTLPNLAAAPPYLVPIEVAGPINFLLIGIWAMKNPGAPYVEGVIRGVDLYRNLFHQYPTVLAGDLNSNTIWDADHASDLNHSALVRTLSEFVLVSSYHLFFGETHGREKQCTFHFQWKEQSRFHIDYCFIPEEWSPSLLSVEIGAYEEWKDYSDHRPLLVEVADATLRPKAGTRSPWL
jgi:hypothetical protein